MSLGLWINWPLVIIDIISGNWGLGCVRHNGDDTKIDMPYDFLYEKTEHVYTGLQQNQKLQNRVHLVSISLLG